MIFRKYFETFICDTEESKAIHHNIRYKVYCEELGYEDSNRFPNKLEYDEYDDLSEKFIVRLNHTKEYVAAFRILNSKLIKLPVEKLCELYSPIEDDAMEISRVCIVRHIRTNNIIMDKNKNIQSSILHGIIDAGIEYCFNNSSKHCYWLITKPLAKLLMRGGLKMDLAGKSCELNGSRFPYKSTVNHILNSKYDRYLLGGAYEYYSTGAPIEEF